MNDDARVDALRHAVAGRIAGAVRHDIVGRLHPLVLLADVLERQLAAPTPDIAALRRNAGLLQTQMKKEVPFLTRMTNWAFPRQDAVIALNQGVAECLSLLSADFGMRGFRFDNKIDDETPVAEGTLRMVLVASLFAAADNIDAPSDFVLQAGRSPDEVAVTIEWCVNDRTVGSVADDQRRFSWADAESIAEAAGAGMARQEQRLVLRFTTRR